MSVITVTSTADSGQGSLREAIAQAKAGDTIRFAPSLANQTILVTSRQLQIDKNLTIDGASAPNLKISGNKSNRVFFVSEAGSNGTKGGKFTLKNLTIADGFIANDRGAAVDLRDGGVLTLENVQFYNNVSTAGAVSARRNTVVTVLNSKFVGNDGATLNDGLAGGVSPTSGGISVLHDGKLTIKNSEFINNKGTYGGGVGSLFTETIVENSIFRNNTSTGFGGGLYVDGASWPTKDKYFPTDAKPKDGPGRNIIVRNSVFEGNKAVAFGGGVAIWGYDHDYVTIESTQVTNNKVSQAPNGTAKGGGIRLSGFAKVNNTTITNNTSESEGGGLWFDGGVPVNVTNSKFSGNRAEGADGKGFGGAIYSGQWNSQLNVSNTAFESNYAGSDAGAIFSQFQRGANIKDSTFKSNSVGAPSGSKISNFDVFSNTAANLASPKGSMLIQGDNQDNRLQGGKSSDRLSGGDGNDTLLGAEGDDILIGGRGKDMLVGQVGNDTLISTAGQDTLKGEAGKDLFIINNSESYVVVKDFKRAEDSIQLTGNADQYELGAANRNGVSGTGIFKDNGSLVAILEHANVDALNLTANYVKYV
jgi:predicted outer membrane repeat protein